MKLVSIDSTGIYTYEYTKKDNIDKIIENLENNKINYYIIKKYKTITILK